MSKVWICQDKTADIPFFLKDPKLNLYSFEELCYYLYQNVEVLEESFFDENLLRWMERELALSELCEKLRRGMEQGKNGFWCLKKSLWESGYYTKKEIEHIEKMIIQIEQTKPEERGKIRADNMLLNRKYKSAIWEYRKLLKNESLERKLEGKIWHNMGTAYAGLFLFARAEECYEKAYTMERMEESKQQYLLARAYAEGQKPEGSVDSRESIGRREIKDSQGWGRYEEEVYLKLEEIAGEYIRSE